MVRCGVVVAFVLALSSLTNAAFLPEYFHTMEDTLEYINSLPGTCPSVEVSQEYDERDTDTGLTVVRVTDMSSNIDKIKIMLVFGEHGREVVTSELARAFLDLVCGVQADIPGLPTVAPATLTNVLRNTEFILVPFANPYGRREAENRDPCAKNNRNGVDLNRNWDVAWGLGDGANDPNHDEYPGLKPFSEAETRILASVAKKHDATVYINVHSGDLGLYLPWDSKPELPDLTVGQPILSLLQELHMHHCAQCRVGTAARELGYNQYGTATDYMLGVANVPVAFTVEMFRGPEGARANHDCAAFFNPVEQRELNSVLARWASFPITVARHFLKQEQRRNQWDNPELEIQAVQDVFNKQVMPALGELDQSWRNTIEWAATPLRQEDIGRPAEGTGSTAVGFLGHMGDYPEWMTFVKIENKIIENKRSMGVLLMGLDRPNDIFSLVSIEQLIGQIREGLVDYADDFGVLTLYTIPWMLDESRNVLLSGKLCESQVTPADFERINAGLAVRSAFVQDLVDMEDIGVIVTVANTGDLSIGLTGAGPVRLEDIYDPNMPPPFGYFSAESLALLTESLTTEFKSQDVSLQHQHTSEPMGSVALIARLSVFEPVDAAAVPQCDFFLINPPHLTDPGGAKMLGVFLKTLSREATKQDLLLRIKGPPRIPRRGGNGAFGMLGGLFWCLPCAGIFAAYWFKFRKGSRPSWRKDSSLTL